MNQFHDILPGSSIGEVYTESLEQYEEVAEIADRVRQKAIDALALDSVGAICAVNPTSFAWHDPVFVPGPQGFGEPKGSQPVEGGVLLDLGELPPYSITSLHSPTEISVVAPRTSSLAAEPTRLENDFLMVAFNDDGDIVGIHDKQNDRRVLPQDAIANQFQLFEDRPRAPDAWEIDIYYDDRIWLAEAAGAVTVVENGPLRATLEISRRAFDSEIVQHISLTHNGPRLDFKTKVQWRERHVMLKVAFPVDVLSPAATYEIQWGNVQRPTHRNTSWDWARFELCAQKWVDLSEGGYGVSLLNDSKYGHDIHENVMRLTLLRGPTDPDPEADLGEHHFTYSLLPHAGSWNERTAAEAYALNDPVVVFADREMDSASSVIPPASSFISVDQSHVIVETVKQAEDGDGLILRLYEFMRKRSQVLLTTAFPLAQAWRTNLLEENQTKLPVDGHQILVPIKPYQVLTLRLIPQ